MTLLAPAAADVPGLYDVIINGKGYIFLRTIDTSLPFRTQRARYSFTPTFLARTNVSSSYGDDQQDFFLTVSQNNWVGGEQQRFAHAAAPETLTAAWRLDNVNVSDAGKVSLLRPASSISTTLVPYAAASDPTSAFVFIATITNLYKEAFGSASSNAHGLGAFPTTCAHDGKNAYLSTTQGGTVGVRTGDASGALTTFSATASDVLAFHNNSLYGLVSSTGILQVYSTAGVATTLYQFKRPDGTAAPQTFSGMTSWGGKLVFTALNQLWMYDGTGVSLLAQFPTNFVANFFSGGACIAVVNGIVLISGEEYREGANPRPVVYYYSGGDFGKLWTSTSTHANGNTSIASFDGGAVWNDSPTARIMYWNPATGAVSSLFAYSGPSSSAARVPFIVANYAQLFVAGGATGGLDTAYQTIAGTATTGSVTSSLYDFDNSLTKLMRGIKVDFDSGTDGDGGSIDIAYRVNDVDGSYTTLRTGAVSGTEYPITGVTGRSISVKVTLNKGSSTLGPVLKRAYVRAAPSLQSYRRCEYILDCSGVNGTVPVILNDNEMSHPLDGLAMAQNLVAATQTTTPFSITDRFGTFTGLIEPDQSDFIEVAPEEYIVRIAVREV